MGPARKPRFPLFLQILLAIVAGIAVGAIWPQWAALLKPLADAFITLIKMLISPIIFCTVVLGIAHAGSMASIGRIGLKALLYFEVITTFALFFGLVVGNLMQPGAGFHVDAATIASGAQTLADKTQHHSLPHAVEFLLGVIPSSIAGAFVENSTLQVLFFSVLFGAALAHYDQRGVSAVTIAIEQLSTIFFTIIGWVMRLAPLGAFGAIAFVIGQYGISSLESYARLIGCCYLAAVLFLGILAGIFRLATGMSLWRFVRFIKDELFLALATASTEVVLPRMMAKLEAAGCSRATTGLVMPTGYSFNLDGAAIYLSVCVLFLAQALDVHLSLGDQLTAMFVLMVSSKGVAAVPGSSFLALSATISALGHGAIPVSAVALLLGADRIMDSMRVTVNLVGNCVAVFVISRWEGQWSREKMQQALCSFPATDQLTSPKS